MILLFMLYVTLLLSKCTWCRECSVIDEIMNCVFILLCLVSFLPCSILGSADNFCWKPGSNPFRGQPRAERLDSDRVRIDWSQVFVKDSDCQNVDFLIKSNPRHSPSDYKLSEFTLKGQTSATLLVTDGEDFVFQVIAREDKRPVYGIEYKYSQMVTSYFWEESGPDIGFKELPLTDKLHVTSLKKKKKTTMAPSPTTTTNTRAFSMKKTTIAAQTTTRAFSIKKTTIAAQTTTRALSTKKTTIPAQTTRRAFNMPRTKKTCPFKSLNPIPPHPLMNKFMAYMNQHSLSLLQRFLRERKNPCAKDYAGFLVKDPQRGTLACCSNPWSGRDCRREYADCDGSCIPSQWVGDGWPDCLDGSDEPDLSGLTSQMHCFSCGGSVLISLGLCENEGHHLNKKSCVRGHLGDGNCEHCLDFYLE
eukprot:TRINITY_DN6755_c0_g1_i2.p1 TRINITY_DN6755_c0_g1~~TRINITY_DN6755_c0_g1_i2.p1  ORF type:complete len:418 (-),score=55.31 TRINITY_DN6755_c0_g1_i2:7-1260(-)